MNLKQKMNSCTKSIDLICQGELKLTRSSVTNEPLLANKIRTTNLVKHYKKWLYSVTDKTLNKKKMKKIDFFRSC